MVLLITKYQKMNALYIKTCTLAYGIQLAKYFIKHFLLFRHCVGIFCMYKVNNEKKDPARQGAYRYAACSTHNSMQRRRYVFIICSLGPKLVIAN